MCPIATDLFTSIKYVKLCGACHKNRSAFFAHLSFARCNFFFRLLFLAFAPSIYCISQFICGMFYAKRYCVLYALIHPFRMHVTDALNHENSYIFGQKNKRQNKKVKKKMKKKKNTKKNRMYTFKTKTKTNQIQIEHQNENKNL